MKKQVLTIAAIAFAAIASAQSGNVGIGVSAPTKRLDIDAGSDLLRIRNLTSQPIAGNSVLTINNNSYVGQTVLSTVAGQFMRFGVNAATYTSGTEAPLRFNNQDDTTEMGNAPNGAANFINLISGATFTEGATYTAHNGTFARTTDVINLPTGIYRITLRLVGGFASSTTNTVAIKIMVGNSEYSLAGGVINTSNSSTATAPL